MSDLTSAAQGLSPGAVVHLYTLDASAIGGGILRFADSAESDGSSISCDGVEYPPINMATEGFAWDGSDLPRPKVTVSALTDRFRDLVIGYDGGAGSVLYRTKILGRFLDGHEEADSSVHWPTEIFLVDRIVEFTKTAIQWELLTVTDQPNAYLPARVAIRDACGWVYRVWDGTAWDYDSTTNACPYAGDLYFQSNGDSTTDPSLDACGGRLSDCILRFGSGQPLPYGGFPGLSRATGT